MTRRINQANPLAPSNRLWHRLKISTQKLGVIVSISAALSGFGYVLLTNQTASQGFTIDDLETHLSQLQASNEKLELEAADLRSLSSVRLTSETLQLEQTEGFEYLPATGAVATTQGPQ
jgi:hypothetical protein